MLSLLVLKDIVFWQAMFILTFITIWTHPHPSIDSVLYSLQKMRTYFTTGDMSHIIIGVIINNFLKILLAPVIYIVFVAKKNLSLIRKQVYFVIHFWLLFFFDFLCVLIICKIMGEFAVFSFVA